MAGYLGISKGPALLGAAAPCPALFGLAYYVTRARAEAHAAIVLRGIFG